MAVWHIEWCERGFGDWSDDVEDGRVGVGSSSGEGEGDILDPELKKWAKTQLTIFINWDFNWRPSWSPLIMIIIYGSETQPTISSGVQGFNQLKAILSPRYSKTF